MNAKELPPPGERVTQHVGSEIAMPDDPVGLAAARFLVELLDGIVVELRYTSEDVPELEMINSMTQASIGSREGPGEWETLLVVSLAEQVSALYGQVALTAHLPDEIRQLPKVAVRSAERIGLAAGLDGKPLPAGLTRALQDAIVVEVVGDALANLQGSTTGSESGVELIDRILTHFVDLSAMKVEGQALSHGVVVNPKAPVDPTRDPYPELFSLKRVPLIFDGQSSVLVVDAAGGAIGEVTRQRLKHHAIHPDDLLAFEDSLGPYGSLVALLSRSYGGIGIYLHPDGTVWVFVDGSPLMVKRGPRWRALPMTSLATGMSALAGNSGAGAMIVRAAILLSLGGHGGILAVADPTPDLADLVREKDRVDLSPLPSSKERAVHSALDLVGLDVQTLVRLAAIDGATVVDRSSHLLAYAAVVSSEASESEGARTAAARHLSTAAHIVLKVSEDGPITVFRDGKELGTILG